MRSLIGLIIGRVGFSGRFLTPVVKPDHEHLFGLRAEGIGPGVLRKIFHHGGVVLKFLAVIVHPEGIDGEKSNQRRPGQGAPSTFPSRRQRWEPAWPRTGFEPPRPIRFRARFCSSRIYGFPGVPSPAPRPRRPSWSSSIQPKGTELRGRARSRPPSSAPARRTTRRPGGPAISIPIPDSST